MKITTRQSCLTLLLSLSLAAALPAMGKTVATDSRINVVFDHPEKFQDLKESDNDWENTRGRDRFLPLIREYVQNEADRLLAPGHSMKITFTDIDLAGDFEPWRGPQFSDVRILKDIYVPRMVLTFDIMDETGKVIKSGEKRLTDLAYQMQITAGFRDDPLRYEKELIRNWLHNVLPARKS